TSGQSAYSAYLAADDDNGNLADGTPHCREIYDAFNAHEIAGAPCAADSPPCSPPAQPVLTPTPGHNRVVLDWTATVGAASYGAVPAGATAPGTAYRAALAPDLTCGDSIPFTLSITDGGGGAATTASFPVLIGQRSSVRYFEDFEGASPGWTTSA